MSTPRLIRYIALGAILATVFIVGHQLATGATRIVVSSGSSMQPDIDPGDLMILRRQAGYETGDVVAYRSGDLGTVLHRIVDTTTDADGTRFVLKGDNNDFIDSYEPLESEILGEAVVTIPGGGRVLGWLPVVVAAAFAAYWVYTRPGPGAPRTNGPNGAPGPDTRAAPVGRRQVLGGIFVVGFGAASLLAAVSPTTTSTDDELVHETAIDVAWSAEPPRSVVYPDGLLRVGDPVFLSELSAVDVSAALVMDADAENVRGTLTLTATVSNDSGWSHRIDLGTPVVVGDSGATAVGNLDLDQLTTVLEGVSSRTGFSPALHQVTLSVDGLVSGSLRGQAFTEDLRHDVELVLDPLMLAETRQTTWSVVIPAAVTVERSADSMIGIAGFEAPVALVRIFAPVGLVIALAVALWPPRRLSEPELINERFGSFVMHVNRAALPEGAATVTVGSFEDLLRLAQIEGSPILHVEDDAHEWTTKAMGVWYRYQLVTAALASGGATASDHGTGPGPDERALTAASDTTEKW